MDTKMVQQGTWRKSVLYIFLHKREKGWAGGKIYYYYYPGMKINLYLFLVPASPTIPALFGFAWREQKMGLSFPL